MVDNKTKKFSFMGWDIKEFLRGRKRLLVAAIGYAIGWVTTNSPAWAATVAAIAEVVYALWDYWMSS